MYHCMILIKNSLFSISGSPIAATARKPLQNSKLIMTRQRIKVLKFLQYALQLTGENGQNILRIISLTGSTDGIPKEIHILTIIIMCSPLLLIYILDKNKKIIAKKAECEKIFLHSSKTTESISGNKIAVASQPASQIIK